MSPTIDPSKLKVTELREVLQARGLDTKGNKPALVKRLKKALEQELKGDTNSANLDSSIEESNTSTQADADDNSRVEDADSSRVEDSDSSIHVEKTTTSATAKEENIQSSENVTTENEVKEPPEFIKIEKQEEQEEFIKSNIKQEVEECTESNVKQEVEECMESNVEQEKEESMNGNEECVVKREVEEEPPVQADITEDQPGNKNEDVEMAEQKEEQKGEKRKRSCDSPERSQKRREVSPIREDEPEIDPEKVLLSWYDSDLNLIIDKKNFLSAKPIHNGLFGYAWAGARATHGIAAGKARYEVKITGELKWEDFSHQRKERMERARQNKERREKERQQEKKKNNEEEHKEKSNDNDEQTETGEGNEENSNIKSEETPEEQQVKKEEIKSENVENHEENNDEGEKMEESTTETNEGKKDEMEHSNENETVESEKILTHIIRVGWSLPKTSWQLGEDNYSYAYESTGKFVNNRVFCDFAASYKLGDVVGAFLDITEENIEMRFTLNGELQPNVKIVPRSELPETFTLFPHILSRNFVFETNFGENEEPWFACPDSLSGYQFMQEIAERIQGPTTPSERKDCEVFLMCGLPGSGKTHWVRNYLKENPDKQMTVIGCSHLLDKMTVHGQPLKSSYNGRWGFLIDKLQRCLNRLTDIAQQRRRSFILDQTNVSPSAQRRKLRSFEGFKRCAVVVVVGDEEQAKRQSLMKDAKDGYEATDYVILEMKANMALPTKGELLDEIIYTYMNEEEATAQVAKYNTEGKAAGYQPGQRKHVDYNRNERNRWNYRRGEHGGYGDRGYQRYDRGPRGWGPPPPAPPGRFMRMRRQYPPPPMGGGGRDWMRNNRGPRDRDNRAYGGRNRNQSNDNGRSSGNWQTNYGQGNWNQQSGNWGSGGGSWGGGYQQQGNWNSSQWKYGGGGGGNDQQGYNQSGGGGSGYGGQNWNNYYGQYASSNWGGQGQGGAAQGSNQYNYAQWAQYAQQYAQGQNAKHGNNTVQTSKK